MKNLLFCLLLPCMFLLGNTTFANGGILEEDGYEAVILIGKMGIPICSFSIPEKYYGKDGELLLPLGIIITKGNKSPVLSTQSKDSKVLITNELSGQYNVSIRIGDFYDVKKIII